MRNGWSVIGANARGSSASHDVRFGFWPRLGEELADVPALHKRRSVIVVEAAVTDAGGRLAVRVTQSQIMLRATA